MENTHSCYRRGCSSQQALRLTVILLLSVSSVVVVEAGWRRPVLSIGVHSDDVSSSSLSLDHALLEMLEPTIQWSADGRVGGVNVEGGVIVTVQDRTNELEIPYTFWAKLKKQLKTRRGTQIAAGMSIDSDYGSARKSRVVSWDVSAQQSNGPSTLAIQLLGESKQKNVLTINTIKASIQKIKLLGGGIWTVMPRYHLTSKTANVIVSYTMPEMATTVTVDGNVKKQKLTVTQKVGEDTIVAPSITTDGDLELVYRRSMASLVGKRRQNAAVFTTTINPKQYIDMEWQDGPWIANVRAPIQQLQGQSILNAQNIKFNIRRVVEI